MGKFLIVLTSVGITTYVGFNHLKKTDPELLAEIIGQKETSTAPLPKHGTKKVYGNQQPDAADPKLIINNTKNASFVFVKFENPRNGRTMGEFFAHPSKIIRTKMVSGTYRVKVAFGATWHGRQRLFGSDTEAYVFDEPQRLAGVPLGENSTLSTYRKRAWGHIRPGEYNITAWQTDSSNTPDEISPISVSDW